MSLMNTRSSNEDDQAVFSVNGQVQKVRNDIDVDTSLNSYLRNHLRLTGTKVMCSEGSCGACVVNMKITDPNTKKELSMPINSCLIPVLACHGASITTVEGIGSRMKGYNKVQTTLAHFNGTQCGFCSPGFVMTMYSLLDSNPGLTTKEAEVSLSGNLCRCTGYRPIMDAFKSLTSDPPPKLHQRLLEIEESHLLCPKRGCSNESDNPACSHCFKKNPYDDSQDFPELSLAAERLSIGDGDRKWYRVASVKEIFEILDMIDGKSYSLVAGNTAKGVTVKTKSDSEIDPQVHIDIRGVTQLKAITSSSNSVTIGSGVTLAEFIKQLDKLSANRSAQFGYAKQISKHINVVANVPVRNLATIGGNLSFSHQHPDFPSDIFLLLTAVSAEITLACNTGITMKLSTKQFLLTDLSKKVITSIILPSMAPTNQLISYKVMQSAQNSPAAVNGAFLYNTSGVQTQPAIVFSGISNNFWHAVRTEAFLTGKNIFNSDTVKQCLKILSDEVQPVDNPPQFSPASRKLLALSLFYKSVLALDPSKAQERNRSGAEPIKRLISSGKQVYYTDQQEWPLTQPMPKLEAQIQCSGEAKYTKDLSDEGNLFGKFVLATKIGKIGNIDGSKATAMKGVYGFYTAKDIPGKNDILFPTEDGTFQPMELLCSGEVTYYGQPVALLVAIDEETAIRAVRNVSVTYKSVRTNIFTNIKDVLASKEQDRVVQKDSFEPAKKPGEAKHKFSGEMEIGGQYSHSMETQSTLVSPRENGQLRIRSATQAITHTLGAIYNITGVPISKLECSVTRVGGGFGSKVVGQLWIAAGAALGAFKLNKPVKMSFTLKEELTVIGKRTPTYIKYQGGINDDGKLEGLDIKIYYNFGSQISSIYVTILPYLRYIVPNCYDFSTWSFTSFTVKTDLPPASILRSPCFNPLYSLTEQIMDHAAYSAKLDPIKVRIANAGDENISKYIAEWRTSTEYDKRKAAVDKFNKENRWKKKGLALCCMKYPFDYYYRRIGCSVSILWPDGTVQIVHGGIEVGQGINTKVAQIVAKELGVDIVNIQVLSSSSKVTPNNHETVASVAGELASYAALKCCQDLNARIEPVKKQMNNPTWKDLVQKLYFDGIDLSANYVSGIEKSKSELKNYNVYGVNVTETEVDILTGERKISRVDILEDVGKSLNPELDVGQVEGAFIMGLGLVTSEQIVIDKKTGAILNNTLWNYKIPSSKDIPEDFRVTFIPNSTNPGSVLGSKAVGEPSLALSVGVINSFRNALMAARHDAGLADNWLTLDSPCTIERLLLNSGTSSEQFTL